MAAERAAPPSHPVCTLEAIIQAALVEDDGGIGDHTCLALIPEDVTASASFLAKATGTLAGTAVAEAVFHACDPSTKLTWSKSDGDTVQQGESFGAVTGAARGLLRAERVALNFMQRMSGIATATAAMVEACAGTRARVLDTRKTVPGLRLLDKWAVCIGGGLNHRMGLYDMIMVKDNHIAAAGGLPRAVQLAEDYVRGLSAPVGIEVETRTLKEVEEVLECIRGASGLVTRVMLDNMAVRDESQPGGVDISMLSKAVEMIGDQVETEASGNVTEDTIQAIARSGCNYISSGALTHSVKALDISFNIVLQSSNAAA